MSNNSEIMTAALYGHIHSLRHIIKYDYDKNKYSQRDCVQLDKSSADLYNNLTGLMIRNRLVWSYDYPSFYELNPENGLSAKEIEEVFLKLTESLLAINAELSIYLLDFMTRLPMKSSLREMMLKGILRAVYNQETKITKLFGFFAGDLLPIAYIQSLDQSYLIENMGNTLDTNKGFIDANDLFKIYNNLLSLQIELDPQFTESFVQNEMKLWSYDYDRLNLIPLPLITSNHSHPETLSHFLTLLKRFPGRDSGYKLDDLAEYINEAKPVNGMPLISDKCNLIGGKIHPDVPEESAENFFSKRFIAKKSLLVDYLIYVSSLPEFDMDSLDEITGTTLKRPILNRISTACKIYKYHNSTPENPITISLILDELCHLKEQGIELYEEIENSKSVLNQVKAELKTLPKAVAEIELFVFNMDRPDTITDFKPDNNKRSGSAIYMI